MAELLVPTGDCWCGCGSATRRESFFLPGHAVRADSMLISMRFGSVAGFLSELGYGGTGRNLSRDFNEWTSRGLPVGVTLEREMTAGEPGEPIREVLAEAEG